MEIKKEMKQKLNENANLLMEKYFNKNIEVISGHINVNHQCFEFIQDDHTFSDLKQHYLLVYYYAFLTRYQDEEKRKQIGFYDHPLINQLIMDCINQYPYLMLRYCCDMNNNQILEELGYDSDDDEMWRTMLHIRYRQIDEANKLNEILNDIHKSFENILEYRHNYQKSLVVSLDDHYFPEEISNIFKSLGYHYIEEIKKDSTLNTKLKHYVLQHPLSKKDEILLSLCLDALNGSIKIHKLLYMNEDMYDFMIERDLHHSEELFNHQDYDQEFTNKKWDVEIKGSSINEYDFSNITLSLIEKKLLSNDIFKTTKAKLNIHDVKEAFLFHHGDDDYMLIKTKSYHLFVMVKGQLINVQIDKQIVKAILANAKYEPIDLYLNYVLYEYCHYYYKTYSKLKTYYTYLRKEKQIHKLDHLVETYVDDQKLINSLMLKGLNTLKDITKACLPKRFNTVDEVIAYKKYYIYIAFDLDWLGED